MKFKNIEVGMKLQNKNTGKIYTVVRDMKNEEYQLDNYYNDVDNLKTNIISKYYNERKMTERTEAFEYENVMNLRHMLLHKQQYREIPL